MQPSDPPATDALGQTFAAAGAEARIASLVPSLTETLFALGLREQIVARTGFCVHPRAGVRTIPKVGGTKDVHLDALRALRPTHVLVNIDENTRDTVDALRHFVPHILVTHPLSPQDNLGLFRLLGTTFGKVPGVAQRAESFCRTLQTVLTDLHASPFASRRVLYLIWRAPWMTVARDTYISRCLAEVGWHTLPEVKQLPDARRAPPPEGVSAPSERPRGTDGHGGDGLQQPGRARYPTFDWSADWLAEVDCVLLSSEPYRFGAAHAEEVRGLLATRGLHPEVRCIPGEWASWYGVRAIDGLRQLAASAALHAGWNQ